MAQVTSVTSEQLQAKIRQLLPSQQGFGEDLQASNVIMPVIDLTAAAEGSSTPELLQTAIAFGSQTAFSVANTTTVLVNTTGFYRIFGTSSVRTGSSGSGINSFTMTDGATIKTVWGHNQNSVSGERLTVIQFDFVVFLSSGDSISAVSPNANSRLIGSSRQIADVNGTLTNPSGFTPQ